MFSKILLAFTGQLTIRERSYILFMCKLFNREFESCFFSFFKEPKNCEAFANFEVLIKTDLLNESIAHIHYNLNKQLDK